MSLLTSAGSPSRLLFPGRALYNPLRRVKPAPVTFRQWRGGKLNFQTGEDYVPGYARDYPQLLGSDLEDRLRDLKDIGRRGYPRAFRQFDPGPVHIVPVMGSGDVFDPGDQIRPETVMAQRGSANVPDTDTVPAMLTPGEAVLNRDAAETFGRSRIRALNNFGNWVARMRNFRRLGPQLGARAAKRFQKGSDDVMTMREAYDPRRKGSMLDVGPPSQDRPSGYERLMQEPGIVEAPNRDMGTDSFGGTFIEEIDGKYYILPTEGHHEADMSNALDNFDEDGEHLGAFRTLNDAKDFEIKYYTPPGGGD